MDNNCLDEISRRNKNNLLLPLIEITNVEHLFYDDFTKEKNQFIICVQTLNQREVKNYFCGKIAW